MEREKCISPGFLSSVFLSCFPPCLNVIQHFLPARWLPQARHLFLLSTRTVSLKSLLQNSSPPLQTERRHPSHLHTSTAYTIQRWVLAGQCTWKLILSSVSKRKKNFTSPKTQVSASTPSSHGETAPTTHLTHLPVTEREVPKVNFSLFIFSFHNLPFNSLPKSKLHLDSEEGTELGS